MTVRCPRCSLPFDTLHSGAQHLWKQQDEAHEDVESLDEGIEEIVADGKSPDGEPRGDGSANGNPDRTVNGTVDGTTNGTTSEPSEGVKTDGGSGGLGLSGPPEHSPADDQDDVDDEPETLDCPRCGTDTGRTEEWFEGKTWQCDDCGTKWRGPP